MTVLSEVLKDKWSGNSYFVFASQHFWDICFSTKVHSLPEKQKTIYQELIGQFVFDSFHQKENATYKREQELKKEISDLVEIEENKRKYEEEVKSQIDEDELMEARNEE